MALKKKSVKQSNTKAAANPVPAAPHDAPFEKALHDLWSAIAVSPIDFIDKVTGKAFTRARFHSIKAGRTVKDIEKFTKHVRKLTKSLAAFVESGGSLETIRDDVKRLGQPAAKKALKKAAKKAAKKTAKKTAKKVTKTVAKKPAHRTSVKSVKKTVAAKVSRNQTAAAKVSRKAPRETARKVRRA